MTANHKSLLATCALLLKKAEGHIAKIETNNLKHLHPNCAKGSAQEYQKITTLRSIDRQAIGSKLLELTSLPWKYNNNGIHFELETNAENTKKLDAFLQSEPFIAAVDVTFYAPTKMYRITQVNYALLTKLTSAMLTKPQVDAKLSL